MPQRFTDSFKAIGTTWTIDINHTGSESALSIFDLVRKRIEVFERQYSRFKKDSIVGKIAENAGVYVFPNDAEPMFTQYRKLYELTEGAMTPLIGQALVDTGYDAEYSLKPKEAIRKVPEWDSVMRFTNKGGVNTLMTEGLIQLDFGALGKGHIIDIVCELLRMHGVRDYTVEAGGDMRYSSTAGDILRIGLEHPSDTSKAIGVAELRSGSICGSAGNRRRWDKYHHVINPKTLESPKDILAVWVVADEAMIADSLTTALLFAEAEKLKKHFAFEYVLMYADNTAFISAGFPGRLF